MTSWNPEHDTFVTARFIVGEALAVIRSLPTSSVQSVITSPPYLAKRNYLPGDDPDKVLEMGQEASPGAFLAGLLAITDELWRVVRDDGTIWVNLGDTLSGAGGAGGDYTAGEPREGQQKFSGSAHKRVALGIGDDYRPARTGRSLGADWPLSKSVCWIPQLFGASLAYGRNLLTGEPCQQWVTRPPVTWCKPNPPVGAIIDKFREATELIVWAAKTSKPGGYYFDLDSIRTPADEETERGRRGTRNTTPGPAGGPRQTIRTVNERGVPPLDWWEIPTKPYAGAHFATFPEALIHRPVIASCPPGGVILDPFAGSGTTLAVAFGNGRSSIGIDLDARNADLAHNRVGMWLEVEHSQFAAGPLPR